MLKGKKITAIFISCFLATGIHCYRDSNLSYWDFILKKSQGNELATDPDRICLPNELDKTSSLLKEPDYISPMTTSQEDSTVNDSIDSQAKNSEGSRLQSDMDHELGTPTLAEDRLIPHGEKFKNESLGDIPAQRQHMPDKVPRNISRDDNQVLTSLVDEPQASIRHRGRRGRGRDRGTATGTKSRPNGTNITIPPHTISTSEKGSEFLPIFTPLDNRIFSHSYDDSEPMLITTECGISSYSSVSESLTTPTYEHRISIHRYVSESGILIVSTIFGLSIYTLCIWYTTRNYDKVRETIWIKHPCVFYLVISVVIFFITIGVTILTDQRATDSVKSMAAEDSCTKINARKDLQRVLAQIHDITADEMCLDLKITEKACNTMDKKDAFSLSRKYMEQNPYPCWEYVIIILCKDFEYFTLACTVLKIYNVPEFFYTEYCKE